MVGLMARSQGRYDAIVSAATLIHFGGLAPVFAAAAAALKNNGLFVFTLFANMADARDFAVAQDFERARGGCYVHSRNHVMREAAAAGFGIEMLESEIQEQDLGGAPVVALVVVLRRGAA
jgi:predicted TPR repeat methyltransferase